jgi:competence protein ComEC
LAAALTAGFNPHSLYKDLGWQLSFAAFAGILLLAPPLSKKLGGERHPIIALAVEAISAYIITLPIILHSFGRMTPIAPLTNLLVMPLVPLAMLASFLAAIAAMIMPLIAGWVSWPAIVLLRFMIGIIEQAARVQPNTVPMTTLAMVIFYAVVGLAIYLLGRQPKRDETWYNDKEETDVGTLKVA